MTQRYQVKGRIGHGGLGEVYLAYDTQLDREVALKRVRPQEDGEVNMDTLASDLIREAKTLSSLQHPNIVTIYDVGRDEKGPFVIMEFLKGDTLDQVTERGKLSTEDFREVVLQVMEGMVAAQSLGLVHRDLKPGNLMVIWLPSGKFQVKILDFGLAKFSRQAVPQTQDQEAGIFGSIFFMAPEQFERLPLDARTDMYSLGCILYQILAQKHPFDGRTPVDVMVSHLQHLVTPLHELRTDIPPWMADWVMWLISREMEDRPADAKAALEHFLAEKSGLPSGASAVAVAAAAKTTAVKVVGRGSAPGRKTEALGTPVHASRAARPTQPLRGGSSTQQIRGGSHSTAVSSRPTARRVAKKSRLNSMSVLTGLLVVGGVLGIFYYIYKSGTKPKDDPRAILSTLTGDPPYGGPDSVRALVSLAGGGGQDAKDALAMLLKLRGDGVPQTVASELEKAHGPMRELLVEAAGAQPSKEGIALLWQIALAEKGELRLKALTSLGQAGMPTDVAELMKQAGRFDDEASHLPFFRTITTLLAKLPDRDARARLIAPALKEVNASGRAAVLRLLGAYACPASNQILAAEIAAGGDRRRAGVEALKTWSGPDTTLADAIMDAAKGGDHDLLTGAYCRTVTRISALSGAETIAALRKALPLADSPKARTDFADALGTLGSKEALDFATEIAGGSDPALASEVKRQLAAVTKQQGVAKTLLRGDNVLQGADAVIVSDVKDASYDSTMRYLTGWRTPLSRFAWDIVVPASITMEVEVLQSSVEKGNTFYLSIGAESVETEVPGTKTSVDFVKLPAGKFTITRPGSWRLWMEPARMTEGKALMTIKSVTVRVN